MTIKLTDETEQKIFNFLKLKHLDCSIDKLSEIVEVSVKEYLEKQNAGIHSDHVFY